MSDPTIQEAISDLAELGHYWALMADTQPEAFLREVKGEIVRLREERDDLRGALQNILKLVNDSRGISGWHLNEDIALWDEFDEIDAAITAVAKSSITG